MFVVLQTEERATGFLQRLREHISPDEPVLTKIAVRNGAPFFILTVKKKKHGIQWEDVTYAAGRCASRIVASKELELPENGPIKRFVPEYLPFVMLFTTALEVIRKSGIPPSDVSLGVIDRRGILNHIIDKAAVRASVLKVVTDRTERYGQASEKLMDECGASLIYGTEEELLSGCNVIICNDRLDAKNAGAAVFSVFDSGVMQDTDRSFTAGNAELPKEYASVIPAGIDHMVFASALYELCGVRRLENTTYGTLYCGKTEVGLYTAARKLGELINTSVR